jgi:hypothetical protein
VNNEILTTVIAALGGILTAYITVRLRKNKPKSEYIDTAFEMYEANAKRMDIENERLRTDNATLVVKVNDLTTEVNRLRRRR